jgi:hypothetical protein
MSGGLLDDPQLIAASARDAGIDPDRLRAWTEEPSTEAALQQDIADSRQPSPAARALDHKLGGPADQRRYTAPSYELSNGSVSTCLPGFNPVEAYEAAIANLEPELVRRSPPESASELLAWADVPLATAEIVQIMQRPEPQVRAELARTATALPAGADTYWSLG